MEETALCLPAISQMDVSEMPTARYSTIPTHSTTPVVHNKKPEQYPDSRIPLLLISTLILALLILTLVSLFVRFP